MRKTKLFLLTCLLMLSCYACSTASITAESVEETLQVTDEVMSRPDRLLLSMATHKAQATIDARTPSATPTQTPFCTATSIYLPTSTSTQEFFPELPTLYPGNVTPQVERFDQMMVESYPNDEGTDIMVRISRGDDFVQELSLAYMHFGDDYFWPNVISDVSAIEFSDFERDGDPEIVLGIHTPGTNCCTVVVVLYFDPSSNQYMNTDAVVNKWSLSPVLADVNKDGVEEIVRHNEEFYDAMWGVGSGAINSPIQVVAYSNGELIDASAQFPSVIAEDAERILKVIQEYNDCSGLLWGCYLVQMHVLGKTVEGWQAFADSCSGDGEFYENQVDRIESALREFGYIE